MKASRFLTVLITFVLAFSVWGAPASVYAKSADTGSMVDASFTDAAKIKIVSLKVNNNTGGILYLNLSGPVNYSFVVARGQTTVFRNITPGKYRIFVRSSACGGSVTINKKLNGQVTLKMFVCKH